MIIRAMSNNAFLSNIITDKPLDLAFDPDTGLLLMVVRGDAEYFHPILKETHKLEIVQVVGLTTESSQSLLAALPKLQSLLEQAVKGPTKPGSVQ